MTLGWGGIVRLCLVNAAIGGLAALPVNLFNRLMTVELALPALLPGLLVALHYAVQITRPVWGHRSDAHGGRTPFIHAGIACVGLGLVATAWAIAYAPSTGIVIAVSTTAFALALMVRLYRRQGHAALFPEGGSERFRERRSVRRRRWK